jgi:hypothetical protein
MDKDLIEYNNDKKFLRNKYLLKRYKNIVLEDKDIQDEGLKQFIIKLTDNDIDRSSPEQLKQSIENERTENFMQLDNNYEQLPQQPQQTQQTQQTQQIQQTQQTQQTQQPKSNFGVPLPEQPKTDEEETSSFKDKVTDVARNTTDKIKETAINAYSKVQEKPETALALATTVAAAAAIPIILTLTGGGKSLKREKKKKSRKNRKFKKKIKKNKKSRKK